MQNTNKIAVDIGAELGNGTPLIGAAGGPTLGQLISNVVMASIVIAGVILLFFIAFGGFKMVQGAGNNNPQETAQGKQAVTYALLGFILVFAAFWIIQLIEAIVGQTFITSPNIPGF